MKTHLARFTRAAVALAAATAGALTVAGPAHAADSPVVVSLTFDDALYSQYRALPTLNAHGDHATFFLNSGQIDKYGGGGGTMSWANARELAAAGNEIGGHTIDHVDISSSTLTYAQKKHQVCDDRARITAQGLLPVTFAYPNGGMDATAKSIVQKCGYKSARSAGGIEPSGPSYADSFAAPYDGVYAIRTLDGQNDGPITLDWLEQAVNGAAANGGGWVPMLFHHVCYKADADYTDCMGRYRSIDADVMNDFLTWMDAQAGRGITVKTMSQALGTAQAPVITGLSRYTVPRGRITSVTVIGGGFTKSTNVAISGAGITIRSLQLVDAKHIKVAVKVGSSARRTYRSVSVVDRVTGARNTLPGILKVN